MSKSVGELYQEHPFDYEERYWGSPVSLNTSIGYAEKLHLQDDPLSHLEQMREDNRSKALAVDRALLSLPPEVVIDEFGRDVALWATLNASISGDNDAMKAAMREKLGIDTDYLETAHIWVWKQRYVDSFSTRQVIAQYEAMEAMRGGAIAAVDLPELLAQSARPGVKLSDARLADYSLAPAEADFNNYYCGGSIKGWGEDEARQIGYNSWLDAPTGFTLLYRGLPNALGGLALSQLDELMAYQIQGVKAYRFDPTTSRYSENRVVGSVAARGLAPLDWQKLMIGITEAIATQMNLSKVAIQAAHNNVWTKEFLASDVEPHLPIERAVKAYDEPAQRMGYVQDTGEFGKNWHKTL